MNRTPSTRTLSTRTLSTRTLSTVAALALGALVLSGCSAAQAAPYSASPSVDPPRITARGVGTVTGTPDIVTVVLGVATQASTATAALEDNNTQATALIEALTAGGVAREDLQTSQLAIYPTYSPEGAAITGYEVTNQVSATLRDITGAGALIDAAAQAVGDAVRVQQLTFSIDDDSAARADARTAAVQGAQTQARQLAEAAGVELGAVLSITELPAVVPGPPYPPAYEGADLAASAVPLEPGTQELSVTVEVVYAISQ